MPKTIHPIDGHVGKRIRLARLSRGISQEKLAEAIGVTFQQVQKYEKGSNRISAARLFECARFLGVDILYFFQDAEALSESLEGDQKAETGLDHLSRADVSIVRSLGKIEDQRVRGKLRALIEAMADTDQNQTSDDYVSEVD